MTAKEFSEAYLSAIYDLMTAMREKTHEEQDTVWLETYRKLSIEGITSKNLHIAFALIHPDFYTRRGRRIHPPWYTDTAFNAGISDLTSCEAEKLTTHPCIFNHHRELRQKCHADHSWPKSLGGPSITDNRMILCRFHNGMKSNGVDHFQNREVPRWLSSYLSQIHSLKQ